MATIPIGPILEFPLPLHGVDRELQEALEIMRASTGKVHPLLDLKLCNEAAGFTLTAAAGAGTEVKSGRQILNTAETSLTQCRLVVGGLTATATATAQLYDATNAVALCTVLFGTADGTYTGTWTTFTQKGNDRALELRIIGDAVHTQTLHSVHAQFRTTTFQQ